MTATAILTGLRMRATSSISASLSTAEASSAPAFLTCTSKGDSEAAGNPT